MGKKGHSGIPMSIFLLMSGLAVEAFGASDPITVQGQVRYPNGPAERAVVYLMGEGPGVSRPGPIELTIRQEGLAFRPSFGVITPGSTVRFENLDHEIHNIKSTSPGNRFDLGAHLPGQIKEVVLKKKGPVRLQCSIHSGMDAILYVVPSIHFAVTDNQGRFEIRNIPLGSYRGEVWALRMTASEIKDSGRTIRLSSGTVNLDFDLSPSAPPGSDLSEVIERDWAPVLREIRTALDEAMNSWTSGRKTTASLRVMKAYSRLYNGSGLQSAIAQRLGKSRAADHDGRFNLLSKGVTEGDPGPEDVSAWRQQKEVLLRGLMRDAEKLHSSDRGR